MKISLCTYHKILLGIAFCLSIGRFASAQSLDTIIERSKRDTSFTKLNMDAPYNRPFLAIDKMPLALGGYLEANTLYRGEEGVNEGLSFQARRLTLFMSATITERIKFLSEVEFEEGGREINIEFAAMDVIFHPALHFRGGIIMHPIGAFNQNHDGPKWAFVERPDVAVDLLPATWSNPGFGIYGKVYKGKWTLGYEAYLSNGFNNSIIDNAANKTFLPAAKENIERFEESNNGHPLFTGKVAFKNRDIGEIGLSYMGGIYNKYQEDGLQLEQKRRLDVFAVDCNTTISKTGTYIVGEATMIFVDIPQTYTQQYGNQQTGFFVDVMQPVLRKKIMEWENATLNVACRIDYVDWNMEGFHQTDEDIGDERWAITPAITFRPSSQTVFRLNYRYQWQIDMLNNPPTRSAAWLFGLSTYF